ncbi:MAG: hypothetical protein EOO92_20690 [Pedobacter sp.]|nr:MAG: hypothetical protein EOO92_20690 [Pedobacter sp.]
MGIQIVSDELIIERNGKKFYLHHGDGLGPGDYKYKKLRKVFRNPICQWLFSFVPPRIGLGFGMWWSGKSRHASNTEEVFMGLENEWLAVYAQEQLTRKHYDYFIFGHRHLPLSLDIGKGAKYINTGEWLKYNSYAEFDGKELILKYFERD